MAALAAGCVARSSSGRRAWTFAAFDLRKVAGKGCGAFASRSYVRGERILHDERFVGLTLPPGFVRPSERIMEERARAREKVTV